MAHSLIIGHLSEHKLLTDAIEAIYDDVGVFYLDPYGHDSLALLDRIPKRRQKDVIWFDLSDTDWPISFNPLDTDADLANLISVLENAIKDSALIPNTSTSVMSMFISSALSLLLHNHQPFLGFPLLFLSQSYRTTLTDTLSDPYPQLFWRSFEEQTVKDKRREFASTFNKAYMMFFDRRVRNILGQSKTAVSPADVLNGQILIARVPVSVFGKERTMLLGLLLLASLHLHNQPTTAKLFVNNAHLFKGQTLLDLLDGHIDTTLSLPTLAPFRPDYRHALLANTRKYVLRVSLPDADILNEHAGPDNVNFKLHQLPNHQGRVFPSLKPETFSLYDLPPPTSRHRPQKIITRMRRHFARPARSVSLELDRFLG